MTRRHPDVQFARRRTATRSDCLKLRRRIDGHQAFAVQVRAKLAHDTAWLERRRLLVVREEVRVIDVFDVLSEARNWIDKGWCQGTAARQASGEVAGYDRPEAASWCIVGSIWKAIEELEVPQPSREGLEIAARALFQRAAGENPSRFNDGLGRTKEAVLDALDRAISLPPPTPEELTRMLGWGELA